MAVLQVTEPNKKERKRRLDELLEEFKIGRLRKQPSIALSGGERRRCGLRALWRAAPPTCCSTNLLLGSILSPSAILELWCDI